MKNEKQASSGTIMSGFFWVACGRVMQTLMQFLVVVILARLISPEDFGVVSAAMIVIGFSEIITELGMGTAIVQRKNLRKQHVSTGFCVSIVLTFFSGVLVFISAPYIAKFFDSGQVEPVLKALSLLFPLRGVGTIGESLAQREMRFRWLATRDVFSFGVGYFVFGLIPALLGYGVWALVSANLATATLKTALLLISYPPKSLLFQKKAFQELFYFGGGHTIARIANYSALKGDKLVVGRYLGMTALGVYGRAYQLTGITASVLGQIVDKVLFPSMAQMQDNKEKLAEVYLRGVNVIATVTLPLSIVGFIVAPEIIDVVLGDQWKAVVLPFRILMLGFLMRSSYKFSDLLAKSTGAVYRRAWRHGLYALTVIVGGWFGHFWGVPGVAVGVLTAISLNFLLMAHMSLSIIGKSWVDFFAVHTKPIFLAVIVTSLTYLTVYFFRQIELPALILLVGTASVLAIFLFVVIKFAPRFFLGNEGLWMLGILESYLPKSISSILLSGTKISSNKAIGDKNASIENI